MCWLAGRGATLTWRLLCSAAPSVASPSCPGARPSRVVGAPATSSHPGAFDCTRGLRLPPWRAPCGDDSYPRVCRCWALPRQWITGGWSRPWTLPCSLPDFFFLKRKAVCLTLYSRLKIEDARTGAWEGTTPLTSHLEVLLLLVISSSLLSDGLVGRWYYFKSAKHQ